MQDTSSITNYDSVISTGSYYVETLVNINGTDYGEDVLYSVQEYNEVFGDTPAIGMCLSGEIEVKLQISSDIFPKMAEIRPYVRVVTDQAVSDNTSIAGYAVPSVAVPGSSTGELISGWIPKGVYYVDTRYYDEGYETLTLHGYDNMLKAERDFPASTLTWGTTSNDRDVLDFIAEEMGVTLDSRTIEAIPSNAYTIPLPSNYTMREVLGYIASIHGGNFIMSDAGELLFIGLADLPEETYYLLTETGNYITFGGTRILLRSS